MGASSALLLRPVAPAAGRRALRRSAARCSAAQGDQDGPSTSGRSQGPASQKVPYKAVLALATAGVAETAYLTAAKLTGSAVACPLSGSGGCASVLTSEYALLLGVVPLSALGVLGYGAVAALAAAGSAAAARAADAEQALHVPLLLGGLGLASCSSYLLYLLVSRFPGELCPWCLASAALSFGIAALAASGLRRRELEEAAAPGAGLVATTLLLLSLGLGNPERSMAGGITELAYKQPEVTTVSPAGASGLARRLKNAGARMYGAFWCSHCFDQKEAFGAEAMKDFPYVECFPNGWRKGEEIADACKAAGLEGFPTWIVGEKRLVGEQTFEELEAALAAVGTTVAPAP